MSRIAANGIEVSYKLEGPAGVPVLMLSNSLLTDYGMWDFQVPALAHKYRLLRYDTRGHGDTQASPGPYSCELSDAGAVMNRPRGRWYTLFSALRHFREAC